MAENNNILMSTEDFSKDISLNIAVSAHRNTSFCPEQRGQQVVNGYLDTLNTIKKTIDRLANDQKQKEVAAELFDKMREKIKTLTLAWLSAKSRCASPMITGPANFPVRKIEKANKAEHQRACAVFEFSENMESYVSKYLKKVYTTQEIQENSITSLKHDLKVRESAQKAMKDWNRFYRSWSLAPENESKLAYLRGVVHVQIVGDVKKFLEKYCDFEKALPQSTSIKEFVLNHEFKDVIPSYALTNNLANIKRIQKRLLSLEFKSTKVDKQVVETNMELSGLKIIKNHEIDRLQLIFDGKPEVDVRSVLKSNGFKWSPKNKAWQRQLTNNAIYSLNNRVLVSDCMKIYNN